MGDELKSDQSAIDEMAREFWERIVIALVGNPSPARMECFPNTEGLADHLVMEWRKRLSGSTMPVSDVPLTAPVTIESLNLGARSYNALANAGLLTVDAICRTDMSALLDIRNFGMGSLRELQRALACVNRTMKAGRDLPPTTPQ